MEASRESVLVVVPVSPTMNDRIYAKMFAKLSLVRATILMDRRPSPPCEVKTPWSKVAVVRNRVLDEGLWRDFSHVLWIDADVVEFPRDIVDLLLAHEPDGVAAPMDLIEGTRTFHDWAAFIHLGRDRIEPENRKRLPGRNINTNRPYFQRADPACVFDAVVQMACVGTVTLVNTDIYRAGARYEDHPAFTDHYPICLKCRQMGRDVVVCRDVVVYHADLPRYGERWK